MPVPTPFHERTHPLCLSYRWKDWAGYYSVCRYDHNHEPEYFAVRQSAGLFDVTPLFKYEVAGRDAAEMLSYMCARDIHRLKPGRSAYSCWCDDSGKVVDDGIVACIDEDRFRITAADPSLAWLHRVRRGFDVDVQDVSHHWGVLALQGPTSREILRQCSDAPLDELRYFGQATARLDGLEVWLSRTGYTGDLGYEIWVRADQALKLWDALLAAGGSYGLTPAGLDALDMTRIEAGFILLSVDYFSATKTVIESRKSSPYEIGLGWAVHLDRAPFVGQSALRRETARGSDWQMVGLVADWAELEELYAGFGLPPSLPAEATREPVPIYCEGRQVGQATSRVWSPLLKKSLALASVRTSYAQAGRTLEIEHTVEYQRRRVSASVTPTPFFDPERKRKT